MVFSVRPKGGVFGRRADHWGTHLVDMNFGCSQLLWSFSRVSDSG